MVVFLPPIEPEFDESVTQNQDFVAVLTTLKEQLNTLKATKQFPRAEIMWTVGSDAAVQANVLNKFGLSTDFPSALVLNPGKKVYKPYIGQFDAKSLVQWITKDLVSGTSAGKVYAYKFEVDFGAGDGEHENELAEGQCTTDGENGGECKAEKKKNSLPIHNEL